MARLPPLHTARSLIGLPLFLLLVASGGCSATPSTGAQTASDDPAAARAAMLPAVFEHLPSGTQIALYTPSVDAFAENVAGPDAFRKAWDGIGARSSHDLIDEFVGAAADTDALAALGVDTSQPAGFAWLDHHNLASTLFWTIGDPALLEAALVDSIAKTQSRRDTRILADARVDYIADDHGQHTWLIARGRYAFLVLCPHHPSTCEEAVGEIAKVTPPTSMALMPTSRQLLIADALRESTRADTGEMLLHGALTVDPWINHLMEVLETRLRDHEVALRTTKVSLAALPPNDANRTHLEAAIAEHTRERALAASRLTLARRFAEEIALPLLTGHLRIAMDDGHLHLQGMSSSATAVAAAERLAIARPETRERFARALAGAQSALFYVSLDASALWQWFDDVNSETSGNPWQTVDALLRSTPFSAQELAPLLDGELAVAVSRTEIPQQPSALDYLGSIEVAAMIGLTDPARFEALIDELRSDPMTALLLRKEGSREANDLTYILTPLLWKPITLAVIDSRLLIASDADVIARYREQRDGGWLDTQPRTTRDALTSPTSGVHLQIDAALVAELSYMRLEMPPLPEPPSDLDPAVPQDRALLDTYEAFRAMADTRNADRWAELFALTRGAGDAVGTFALSIDLAPDGDDERVVLEVHQHTNATSNAGFFLELGEYVREGDALIFARMRDRNERIEAVRAVQRD